MVGFGLVAAVFALIYKVMPRVRLQWHDVTIGALVTATLFSLGKALIGVYIGRSGIATAFGAAGSLVVVLVWVYYSAQIFLLGAEFTWVFANTYGSRRGLEVAGGANLGLNAAPEAQTAAAQTPTAGAPRPAPWDR